MLDETFVLFRDLTPGRTIRVIVQPLDAAEPTAEIELHVEEEEEEEEAIMATYSAAIAQSSDDARQQPAGNVILNDATIGFTNDNSWVGLRWATDIPAGSAINSAKIQFLFNTTAGDSPQFNIYGEKTAAAATYAGSSNEISGRTRTTEVTNWSQTDIGTGSKDTPDLSDIVTEIMAETGWNGVLNFILDALSGCAFSVRAYDNGSDAPTLIIDYTPPAAGTVTPKTARIRLTTKVGGVLSG